MILPPRRIAAKIAACIVLCTLFSFVAPFVRADDGTRYEPSTRSQRAAVVDLAERWRPIVASYVDWDADTAIRIIGCESRGDPAAVNPSSGAAGLFQTMPDWQGLAFRLFGSGNLFDPAVNVGLAHFLWQDDGGRFGWHWASSVGCWSR
jgi:soluble lytic murein transglycosylase-like protein